MIGLCKKIAIPVIMILGLSAMPAEALMFEFVDTNSNIGQGRFVDVTESVTGADEILFMFTIGPEGLHISDIYFADPTDILRDMVEIQNSAGVSFAEDKNPKTFPGGNLIGFITDFSAGAVGAKSNGLDIGESLGIVFNLENGMTYNDTIVAMQTGDLRIGAHGSDTGTTESSSAPEPSTILLLGTGLVGLVGLKRKFAT